LRIAILNAGHMTQGGTERVVAHQARELHNRDHQVQIFVPYARNGVFDEVIPEDVAIDSWGKRFPVPRIGASFNRLLHFWSGVSKLESFDILIAHNQPAPYAAYKVKKGFNTPYLVYMHGPWRRLYPRKIDVASGWAGGGKSRILGATQSYWKRIDRTSVLASSGVLANSRYTMREVEALYGVLSTVCYPGVDVNERAGANGMVEEAARRYDIDEHTILSVGRHVPQKKLEWIPEILRKVTDEVPPARFLITGRPTRYTQIMMREAERRGLRHRLILAGEVAEIELMALYRLCPILCSVAVEEEFSLAPIEAMASGCVPLAWNEAGPAETIEDGVDGFLAPPYDLTQMAGMISTLLMDHEKRENMSKKAREKAASFTWKGHADILEEAIQQALVCNC